MVLTVFNGKYPTREEAHIAKNYLNKEELEKLNRLVGAFFDLAELKAMEHIPMYMSDWVKELDDFTSRYGKGVLLDSGSISHEEAIIKADEEYDKYKNKINNELSDVEIEYFKLLNNKLKNLNVNEEELIK